MQDESLYDVLGVTAEATPEQIRLAFLSLAHRFHPDLNSNESHEERFKQIRHAYEILSSSDRRKIYDRTHDSYAATIRQTAPPTPKSKSWARRATDSAAGFRTNLLNDRKLSRDRWFFVLATMVSAAIVIWAAKTIPRIHRESTEPTGVARTQVQSVSDTEIPTNLIPDLTPRLRRHFEADSPNIDDQASHSTTKESNVEKSSGEQNESNRWNEISKLEYRRTETPSFDIGYLPSASTAYGDATASSRVDSGFNEVMPWSTGPAYSAHLTAHDAHRAELPPGQAPIPYVGLPVNRVPSQAELMQPAPLTSPPSPDYASFSPSVSVPMSASYLGPDMYSPQLPTNQQAPTIGASAGGYSRGGFTPAAGFQPNYHTPSAHSYPANVPHFTPGSNAGGIYSTQRYLGN